MKDIKVEVGADGDDSRPLCSHCGKELTHVDDHRSHLNLIYNLHVCSCPHCRKVLGVSTVLSPVNLFVMPLGRGK
jgi:hypothetical protein